MGRAAAARRERAATDVAAPTLPADRYRRDRAHDRAYERRRQPPAPDAVECARRRARASRRRARGAARARLGDRRRIGSPRDVRRSARRSRCNPARSSSAIPSSSRVPALAELAVSLYLPEANTAVTTHELALNTTYVAGGNAAGDSGAAARRDEPHLLLAGGRRGPRPRERRHDPSVRRLDHRRFLDHAECAPRLAGAARCEAAERSRNGPLGRGQCRHLGQPRPARPRRHERARPVRS